MIHKEYKYNLTKMDNGVTVITESESMPGNIHMGILVDVGTRDETVENSGSLAALKNIFLKT